MKFVLSSPVSFLSAACLWQPWEIDWFLSAVVGLIVPGEGEFDCVLSGAVLAAAGASSVVFGGGAVWARELPVRRRATVRLSDITFIVRFFLFAMRLTLWKEDVEELPAEGFEPPTYGLQNRCTTTVLSRHINN